MLGKVWTAFLLFGAAAAAAAWIVALCHEKGIRPFAGVERFVRGLPWGGRLALLPLFLALVVYGSTKMQSKSTVEVEGIESKSGVEVEEKMGEVHSFVGLGLPTSTNATSYFQLPTLNSELITPTVCEDWLKFGGFEDWIYLGPGGWSFRHGSNFVERLAVFSSGKIRLLKQGGGDAWIALSAVPISIVPEANWHRLKTADSLFWHAETPSNTLLLTWCNALLNRDTNSPVNIQAELFPSGRMRITHDLSGELVTEHVPAPELPCADTLDEVLARIEGGNSNAYFFADVAVAKGPAVVKVKSGRETTLGDYSFVAHPGVTNRLPFLIGPEYEVKSEAAYSHFSVTNIEVAVSNLTDRLAAVQWPVKIDFGEGYDFGGGKLFEVAVDPPFLNGIMEFDGNANGNMRMLPRSGGGCGCVVSVTNGAVTVTGVCSNDTCVHEGSYVYEGYRERIELECEMDSDEDPEPEPDDPSSPEEENEPGASVWFEEKAIIFEDEYENAPGETVPRRSTRTKLKCWAYGGERGGNFTVDLSGMGALRLVSGTPPSGRTLAPGEYVEYEAEYEAEKASSQENSTVAKVSFTENETNITFDDEDKMTVVEVTISPAVGAPENSAPGRHKVGVYEAVECRQKPNLPKIQWIAESGGSIDSDYGGICMYRCPMKSCSNPLSVKIDDITYVFNLTVIEPSGIEARNVEHCRYGYYPNVSGFAGMRLNLYVKPFDVSFEALAVVEIPCNDGVKSGHFALPYFSNIWSHTSNNGAGNWINIRNGNFFADDEAALNCEVPQAYYDGTESQGEATWRPGYIKWEIPFGWNIGGTTGNEPYHKRFSTSANMEMFLSQDGTVGVKKLDNFVERMTNDFIRLNGKAVYDNP